MMVDMRKKAARARQAMAKAVSCEMGGVFVGRQTSMSTSGASEIIILILASCLWKLLAFEIKESKFMLVVK